MQPRFPLAPVALIQDDTQNALITQQLGDEIDTLFAQAQTHLQEQKTQLAPARKQLLLENITRQFNYLNSNYSSVNRFNNPILFFLKETLPNFDNSQDEDWDKLLAFLNGKKLKNFKNIFSHEFQLLIAIRYECEAVFPLVSLMPNHLDQTIALMNTKQNVTIADCQQLFQDLCTEFYYIKREAEAELTEDQLILLIPTMKLLIEKNLLTKFNFIRLLLFPNHRVSQETGKMTCYYSYPKEQYYHRSIISCDLTANAISLLAQRGVLTQYNLETLFKIFKIYVDNPALLTMHGWDFSSMLESLVKHIKTLKIDPHNDTLEDSFIKAWFRNYYTEHSTLEQARIADSALFDVTAQAQKQLSSEIVTTLATCVSTASTITEAKDQTTSAFTQIVRRIPFATNEQIAKASAHADDLAKMQLALHRDGIATPQNLVSIFKNAELAGAVTTTYHLLQETQTYATPQARLDAIVPIAQYAEHINAMLLWLPPEQRTPATASALIENPRFAEDLLTVCAFEHKHYTEDGKFSAFINVFGHALDLKKEYLPALKDIYEFLAKWNSGLNAQHIDCLNPRMAMTPAIAQGLKQGYKEGMTSEEMGTLWNEVLQQAETNNLAKAKEWSKYMDEFIRSLNQCEVLVCDSPDTTQTLKRTLNAAYLIFYHPTSHQVFYSNQAKGIDIELRLKRSDVKRLRARFNSSRLLETEDLRFIKTITNHEHTVLSNETTAQIRKRSSYNLSIDLPQLLQAYGVLISGECFEQGAIIIENYPEYALPLAAAIVELKKHGLLEAQYIELLEMQRDLAVSISSVLIFMQQNKQLTPANLEHFKMHINDAPRIAKAYREKLDEEKLTVLPAQSPTHNLLLPEQKSAAQLEVLDDEDLELTPLKQTYPLPPVQTLALPASDTLTRRKSSTPGDEKDFEAFHSPVLSSSPPALHKRQDSFSLNSFDAENEEFYAEVIKRCMLDYQGSFFGRSNFLKRIQSRSALAPKDRIENIEDIRLYAMAHPNSRTARIYAQVYTERSFDLEVKEFFTEYFKEFTFSWYQKSTLVQKLFNDEIESIETIEKHAKDNPNPNNRTAQILSTLRR